jgi:uncharacterized membrane-anchored protein
MAERRRSTSPVVSSLRSAGSAASARSEAKRLAVKVPEITVMFWVLKLLTTGMGEAMSDFLGQKSIPLAAAVGIFGLAWALYLQLRAPSYSAPRYWFAVMMVAVFGTMVADGIRDGAGLTYTVTTPLFAALVAIIFALWYRSERTLSIHSINTRRRERFYWLAVLATFALGTAAGDLTAYTLKIGFFPSAILFAVVIALPGLGWWRGALNPILAFWAAYVVTRPLGASFADGFSKPPPGLGMGDGAVAGIALIIFIALVAYVARTEHGVQQEPPSHPHGPHPRAAHSADGRHLQAQPAEN